MSCDKLKGVVGWRDTEETTDQDGVGERYNLVGSLERGQMYISGGFFVVGEDIEICDR